MQQTSRRDTEARILDGAAEALALHGLGKLGMRDVCDRARVSRGTLYRYFATRDALLLALAHREAARFRDRLLAALEAAPRDAGRLQIVLQAATRHVQQDPALQRLLRSDAEQVLVRIRDGYGEIRSQLSALLGPILASAAPVRAGVVGVEPLVDCFTRILISIYLFPGSQPERLGESLAALYEMLVLEPSAEGHGAASASRTVEESP